MSPVPPQRDSRPGATGSSGAPAAHPSSQPRNLPSAGSATPPPSLPSPHSATSPDASIPPPLGPPRASKPFGLSPPSRPSFIPPLPSLPPPAPGSLPPPAPPPGRSSAPAVRARQPPPARPAPPSSRRAVPLGPPSAPSGSGGAPAGPHARRGLFDEAAFSGAFNAQSTIPGFRPKSGRLLGVKRKPGWPLLPLPPAIVVAVGLAVAVAIGIVGIDQFSRTSDERAAEQATLLIASLSTRLPRLPASRRLALLQQAAHMSDAEFLVVDGTGAVLLRVTDEAPDEATLRQAVALGQGDATTSAGPTKFAARALSPPMGGQALIAFVPASYASERAKPFVSALLALTILLLGVASAVASAVARDAIRDVEFVTERIVEMSDKTRLESVTTWVPLRAFDEVGILTSAFNDLVARFAASEKSYLVDLDRATEADRDRAAFLAAVSHELRSPLNAVLGFADILLAEVDGPLTAEQREEVEQIRDSGQHLLELISDILEFSALETGQLKLSKSPTDLTALAHEVTREQAVRLKDKPVVLRVEGSPGIMGDVDARRVRQVITNLVGNAIKFTQEGEIVVKVAAAPRFVSLSVIDTGLGIGTDERAVIFEEYKQAHGERARKRGTGLGLAIARRLVLLHSGTIQLESELGRGSKFHVYLPIWKGNAASPLPGNLSVPTSPPSGSGKRGAVS